MSKVIKPSEVQILKVAWIFQTAELMSGLYKCLILQACEWAVNFQQYIWDQA